MSKNITNRIDNLTAEGLKSERLKKALDGPFARLVGKRVLSPAHATREMDGRLVPFVVATVLDDQRRPVAGVPLELRDDEGKVLDATRTSAGGLGILRFPARRPRPARKREEPSRVTVLADGGDIAGTVFLLDGSESPASRQVTIPPNRQAAKAAFLFGEPFRGVDVRVPPGDDPVTRLPIDFSEDACNLLLGVREDGLLDPNDLFTRDDPLLSPAAGVKTIAGKRLPLLRRLDIIRFGEDDARFLVRLRQEWVLLAYTLGELADVTALDPGAVLQSANQLVSEVSTTARELAETTTSTLEQTLQDVLSNRGSIDSVVSTVQNTSVSASIIGGGIFAGIFGFGGARASASTHLDLTVNTNINTSLLVNRAVQQVSTLVNEAISRAKAVAEGFRRSTNDVVNHLAPLITQVANALHWRVYEVYAVCTNVDAVHPIIELQLFDPAQVEANPFSADDVRAYRPFFEPALLDRTLASGFDALTESAGLPPLNEATVEVTVDSDFSDNFFFLSIARNALVTMTINGITSSVTVPRGSARTGTLRFNFTTPVTRGAPLTVAFAVAPAGSANTGTGTVRRVEVWVDRPLSGPGFILDNPDPSTGFQVPIGGSPLGADALLTHINHHRHYYYGVLAAAAIAFPSLRQDAPQLAGIDPRLWRLPLVGFEGTVALLVDEATTSVDVTTLLDDPGAGTLVQILAPGSYGEVLTGLLDIPLDALHPLLTEVGTISPFGDFPSLPTDDATSAATGVLP
jgi:hypothetical protein